MKVTAAPGIYLIEPIKDISQVNYGKVSDKKLLKGKIISKGQDRDHDQGGRMEGTYEIGDIVYFLTYQEAYDHIDIKDKDGKYRQFYLVLFHDVRAKYEE